MDQTTVLSTDSIKVIWTPNYKKIERKVNRQELNNMKFDGY